MNKNNKIQFLECYEKHSCLWDPREHNYRNKSVRLAALKSIIDEMHLTITVEELKVKIKNIRTTYNREANKITNSKKSGAGMENIYTPQLSWFSTADRFLKPVIEGRSSRDNMAKESENSAVSTATDSSSYFDEVEQRTNTKPTEKKRKFLFRKKSTKRVPKRRKVNSTALEADNKLESLTQNIHQDEFDIFGQHVANQLRSLPLVNAIVCEKFINNCLSQERLKTLNFLHYPTSTPV